MESNVTGKIRYAFRRPSFPMICAVGNELLAGRSPASFQRQIERLDLQGTKVIDIVDATGEGWALHAELMMVSPLTLKKRWKKAEVIRIAEVAALAAFAKSHKPLQRTGARVARPGH